MRIALRTSGGRGEYELAGRQGEVTADDLFGLNLLFELTPDITIDGHSAVQRRHGKPRIRLDDERKYSHAYSPLAGALLLPRPKRELGLTSTDPDFIRDGDYAVTDIDVDVAEVTATAVSLRPTVLWLGNAARLVRSVDVARRMSRVQAVWDAAKGQESPVASLVQAHEEAVLAGDHRGIKKAAEALGKQLGSAGDILNQLSSGLGIEAGDVATGSTVDTVPTEETEDDVDPTDAARRTVSQWRKSVVRSAEGRAFSQRVRAAYGNRCALSGDTLPKLPGTLSPGVDGAHILPWARYELNTVRNGICLNKLCHWAFDAGVVRIDWDESAEAYIVSVPQQVRDEGLPAAMSLGYFEALEGPIPVERLPSNPDHWPSPAYLQRLNDEIFG